MTEKQKKKYIAIGGGVCVAALVGVGFLAKNNIFLSQLFFALIFVGFIVAGYWLLKYISENY